MSLNYRIYEYMVRGDDLDWTEVPFHVNWKTELVTRLHPEHTIVKGELVKSVYHAEFDGQTYAIPICQSEYVYDRDPNTLLANYRTETISWFMEDGSVSAETKVLKKYYSSVEQKRSELHRKRKNMVNRGSEIAIYGQVLTGKSELEATRDAQSLWAELVGAVSLYEQGSTGQLIGAVMAATDQWLDLTPAQFGGASIRQAILGELS